MWNYRIMRKYDEASEEHVYFLSEVYYEKDGKPMAYTDNDFICGNTKDEIVSVLEMMLADVKKRQPVLTDKDFKV